MKHLKSLFETTAEQIDEIFAITADLKEKAARGGRAPLLAGRVMTLLFEKPSLRTRISFEAAMTHLGGNAFFLTADDAGLAKRESVEDAARVLGSYSDCIVMRTFSQGLIEQFVKYAGCSIINGLSNDSHPCQALTDLFTIKETFGDLEGRTLAFVGDGNNVARSLATGTALCGMKMVVSSPAGYELPAEFLEVLKQAVPSADLTHVADAKAAVADADVVYTDVWASMGQEEEIDIRKKIFAPYQANAELMAAAPAHARFMHCLPAKRGQEVTDEVIDGPQAIAFQQAENRMHLAKGLLVWLLDVDATA